MINDPLGTFFSVAAQIIFTIFGFVLVALTIDKENRNYWLSEKRRRYTIIHLFSLILPGILALMGTSNISDSVQQISLIRAWVFASGITEFLYVVLLIEASKQEKTLGAGAQRLKADLWKFFCSLLFIAPLSAYYYSTTLDIIADALVILYILLGIFFGISSVIAFLEPPQKEANAITNEIAIPNVEQEQDVKRNNLGFLLCLMASVTTFLIGYIIPKKKR